MQNFQNRDSSDLSGALRFETGLDLVDDVSSAFNRLAFDTSSFTASDCVDGVEE